MPVRSWTGRTLLAPVECACHEEQGFETPLIIHTASTTKLITLPHQHSRIEKMRDLILLAAIAMPLVATFSNMGYFGPTNGQISNQYPTLIVAAGYAFSIWGVIFLLALALGYFDWRHSTGLNDRTRLVVVAGYLLTTSWMVVFSQYWFWAALVVMVGAWACLLFAAIRAHDHG